MESLAILGVREEVGFKQCFSHVVAYSVHRKYQLINV